MPLAGAFCESFAWRLLYYSFGTFGVLSTSLFFALYREDPKKHRLVSARELRAILTGKEGQVVRGPVPYKEICKDPCMQSVLLSSLGGNTGFFIFLHFGPTFMNKAIGIDVADTGFATALPYALAVALKFVAGPLFDVSTFISEKNRLIMFSSLSQGVMGFCFFVISQKIKGVKKCLWAHLACVWPNLHAL
uniref:MFS domain-containing protein n=1 Tax=Angiostrongylus cantonensis TaxID=6313 RepID=A0A0K0D1K0_ANGCA